MGSAVNSGNASKDNGVRSILVLDDELAVRKALARLLKSLGHECTTAATGEELLDLINSPDSTNPRFDLMIMDIKISGGMGGIETMQKVMELGITIPMVSMSGYSTEELFESEKDSVGFSGHLPKPFNKIELVDAIDRLCPAPSGKDRSRTV